MKLLENKVAIVTGAAGGIGAETALTLAEAGARVVVTDLSGTPYDDVASDLRTRGFDAVGHELDVSSEEAVSALVDFAVATFGGIDVLNNNAAATDLTAFDGDVTAMTTEVWDRAMAVNVRGPMLMCKHVVPVMVKGGGGSIINITSGLSLAGEMGAVAYGASKAALNQLTRSVATSHGASGIRCNALALGLMSTPKMLSAMPEQLADLFVESMLVPRLGEARDVGNAVVFLASSLSAYITAQIIQVDGGFLSHLPTYAQMRGMMQG